MLKVGGVYRPCASKIVGLGKYTEFSIPQQHKVSGKFVKDGFINVLAPGEYDFQRGDTITISEITAATLIAYNGKQYFSVYAVVGFHKKEVDPTKQIIEEDISEEYL